MKATDLPLLSSVSRPTIHPDGSRAVVAVSRPDLDSDRNVGQLWTVQLGGGGTRRLTRGVNDSNPIFSPDGALLAFVRSTGDQPGQLFVVDVAGGEAVQVTDAKLGIGSYRWSPNSMRIAFTSPVPEDGRYGTVKELDGDVEPPRRITTLKYRSNGVGYTIDRRRHIFLVDVPDTGAEPGYPTAPSADDPTPKPTATVPVARRLTSGDVDHGGIAFSPDGVKLAFVSTRHEARDHDLASNIFELDLEAEGAEPTQITGHQHNYGVLTLVFAVDGALFFLASELGESARDFVGTGTALYVLDRPGVQARRLTDPAIIDLGEVGSDLTVVGDAVLVQNRARGRVELLRVTRGGTTTVLSSGDLEITGHDAVGETIVASFRGPATQGDLGLIQKQTVRALTDFSRALRDSGVIEPTELTISARDGYPVHGWVLTPAGEGPHPVLLNIHGGPFAQYEITFFDEAQVYAGAGYAVVMCNPRGSAGYGQAHARAIRHRMGTVDYTDVIDFLDGALAQDPAFDATRVGIMGGSYGGYLTAWTIAHDHRFAAAVVERGYLDPEYFVGTSDIGSFFSDEYAGTDPELVRAQSPQAVVGQVTTPALIIHSANDLRCPLGQGERYYAALKRNGVPTELLVFPGENHELSRSGRPRHRLQRFEAILQWWARYLPTVANPAGGAGA